MKRPLIGIIPQLDIENPFRHVRLFPQYQRSIERAGGIGVMLPFTNDKEVMKEMANSFDGFLFTGGQDINPELYGQKEGNYLTMSTGYAPERDDFESAFYPILKELNKPILAICRGFQIINVLHGGTILQDLPYEPYDGNFVLHPAWDSEGNFVHEIYVRPNTKLREIMRDDVIPVNSYHHQGIGKVGEGLTISGVSPDGLVEAFDIDDLDYGVGVQWHPEVLFDNNFDDGRLFKSFIEECRKRMK